MSVSKYRYTEDCDGRPCPGDCDLCSFEPKGSIRDSYTEALEALDNIMVECDDLKKGLADIWNGIKAKDHAKVAYIARELQGVAKFLKMDDFDMKQALADLVAKADAEANNK